MSGLRTYYYRVLESNGAVRTGFYQLAVSEDASARLRLERELGGTVVGLTPLPAPVTALYNAFGGLFSRRVSAEDRSSLLRDLGVMLSAGVPVLEALQTIISERRDAGAKAIAHVAEQLHDDMDSGMPVSEAFGRRPDIFPETVRNLVAIGDRSGSVDRMLVESADHTERMINIGRDIRTALIYPAFVFSTLLAVMVFWMLYVVPTLGELFQQLDADLPAMTIWLISAGETVADHIGATILITIAVCILTVWFIRRHEPTRRGLHTLFHKLPISGRIMTASGMAALTEHLQILVRSGLDILTSLDVLTRTTRDLYYRSRLERVSEAVRRGEGIGAAMRLVGGFPPMVVRMVAVGEESGSLDTQLDHLAREYRKRLDIIISSISEIIKPVIVLIAGGLFFFLVVALLLPIYDLIRQTMEMNMGGP